ncbi:MAG: hypothetical protein GY773_06490, partial [Actinomycetia bacterium]|nr:hypothetical protein [Actinomycetes bacterium]
MTVCTCGYEAPSQARFCGGCGCAVDRTDVPLLDIGGPSVETAQTVVKRTTSLRWWATIVGVVCVCVISWSAWSLATGSDAATDSDSASPEAATPDEAADPDTEETDVEAATGADQETSTTQRTTTSQTSPIEIVDIPAPILGEEVGYDLIISTSSRPAILNLDSGEIRYTEGSRATPLAVTGDWLIVRTANDRPAAFRLDDLAADPTQLPFSPSTWPQLIDYRQRDDGKAWFSVYGDTGPGLPETVLVDIASGAIVDEVVVPDQIGFNFGSLP